MKIRGGYMSFVFTACLTLLCFHMILAAPISFAATEATPQEKIAEELPPEQEEATFSDRFMVIVDFDAFLTRSDLSGAGSLEGGALDLLFAPVFQMNDRAFFILMYDGHYYKKRELYSDDEGAKERTEFQSHTVQPMTRFDFGSAGQYSLTPSLFHTATYNKDVDTSSSWSNGLYNYRDYGAGLDFDWRGLFGDPGSLKAGAQCYSREYPNYTSLLTLTGLDSIAGNNTEPNEKDYHGLIGKAGYEWIQPLGFSWGAEYSLLHKDLDDKKVVDSNGVLTSERQEDLLHTLDLNSWYVFDIGGGLKCGLDLTSMRNDSNQNFFDGDTPAGIAGAVFTEDYYDYYSYRIRPNVSYTLSTIPLTGGVSYAYNRVEYDERKAKESNGTYTGDSHYERQNEIVVDLRYDLTDNWSIIGEWQNMTQRSNNDDQRTYRYEYTINNYSIGVAFKY